MTRHQGWEPTDADLVAFLFDDLDGARAEYVESHVAHCSNCRARLAELRRTVDRLQGLPDLDGDGHLLSGVLKARIQFETSSSRRTEGWLSRARIGAAAAAVLALVILAGPPLTGVGGSPIDRVARIVPGVEHDESRPRVFPGDRPFPTVDKAIIPTRPTIDPSNLPYAPIVPMSLPGSNRLVSTTAFSDGTLEARYVGDDGLELVIIQAPATIRGVEFEESSDIETFAVRDTQVIIQHNRQLNGVSYMTWGRGGFLFSVRALIAEADKFPVEEALELAARLMDLQDDPNDERGLGSLRVNNTLMD